MTRPELSLSLVLGSGGARGHAHIGVIRAVEERGLKITNIAGTSMGAVIGGIYATGKLDTYADWATKLVRNDIIKLLDFSFTWTSVFKGERIFDVLEELIGDCKIEELDIGFTAVATALDEQREVWLGNGSLFRAIRASTAVPGLLTPVEIEGSTLVDGGLVNPIPIAPTLNDKTDLTIAVNLSGIDNNYRPDKKAETASSVESDDGNRNEITRFISGLFESDNSQDSSAGATEILTKSLDVMQGEIARLKLGAYAPQKIIEIPRDACSFFEFHRAEEMADLGYKNANEALDELGLQPSDPKRLRHPRPVGR